MPLMLFFSNLRSASALCILLCVMALTALPLAAAAASAPESVAASVEERGIVQCGNADEPPCTICDLFATANRLVNFVLFGLMAPLAAGIFMWGGALLLTSRGSETQRERGKKVLAGAVIGVFLAFAAWAIVNTIIKTIASDKLHLFWQQFPVCGAPASAAPASSAPPAAPSAAARSPGAAAPQQTERSVRTHYTDDEARERLAEADIAVNSETRTSLEGVSRAAIAGITDLKRRCQCEVVITGGTETGHAGSGPGTHLGGDKLDFRITDSLVRFMTRPEQPFRPANFHPQCHTENCAQDPLSGLVFVREGDHFDVCFANCSS